MTTDTDLERYGAMPKEQYEEYVLCAFMHDQEFFQSVKDTFCFNTSTNTCMNEFSVKLHYAIYRALLLWYNLNGGSISPLMQEKDIMEIFDILSMENVPVITSGLYRTAVAKYTHIRDDISDRVACSFVKNTFKVWWEAARQRAILDKYSRYTDTAGKSLLDELTTNITAVKESDAQDAFKDFDIIIDDDADVKRIPLGADFRNLSNCLGGGLGRSEHAIFVAPTGAGKTVFGCQLASSIADLGSKVLFITTEQPVNELIPRIMSCWSFKEPGRHDPSRLPRIPFSLIKDGFSKKVLESMSAEQKELLQRYTTKFSTLHFEEWLGTTKDAKTSLRDSIRRYIDKYDGCDCVILDWIGAKLGYGMEPQQKRQEFYDAAQTLKDLSYEFNMAALSTAQATAQAVGKKFITEHDIATCKTLHEQAAVGFGLSAMRTIDAKACGDNAEMSAESYTPQQNVYCFKSRKSTGKHWVVTRNFGYQRFDNF